MQVSLNEPIGIKQAANLYAKHSTVSFTNTKASDALSDITQAEIAHDLKKALILAIEAGNFEKALFILMRLREMGIVS